MSNALLISAEFALDPQSYRVPLSRLSGMSIALDQLIRVASAEGFRGQARVIAIDDHNVTIHIETREPLPRRQDLMLICGLSRPQTIRKVIGSCVAFGVSECHFVRCERSEKSYLDSKALETEAVEEVTTEMLEQVWDASRPGIRVHPRFKPFVEDLLMPRLAHFSAKCILDVGLSESPFQVAHFEQPSIICVGPEAGWNEFERSYFERSGFESFSLGQRILRTDQAVAAALAISQTFRNQT